MYTLGHIGTGLLLFAPAGYVLVARDRTEIIAPGLATALALTFVPDMDLYFPAFIHRGVTHSFLATGCIGVFAAMLWVVSNRRSIGTGVERARYGFLFGSLGGLAHLLGDVITPMGVRPFLPWNETLYTLAAVYSSNPRANLAMLGIGATAFSASIHLARLTLPRDDGQSDESPVESSASSDTDPS